MNNQNTPDEAPITQADGVVLLGHGSRDPLWQQPMEAVARRIAQLAPQLEVRCAFLELAAPDLEAACAALLADGRKRLVVLPMFLGMGRHAREDIPRQVQGVTAAHPELQLHLAPAIGESALLADLLAHMACQAAGLPPTREGDSD